MFANVICSLFCAFNWSYHQKVDTYLLGICYSSVYIFSGMHLVVYVYLIVMCVIGIRLVKNLASKTEKVQMSHLPEMISGDITYSGSITCHLLLARANADIAMNS